MHQLKVDILSLRNGNYQIIQVAVKPLQKSLHSFSLAFPNTSTFHLLSVSAHLLSMQLSQFLLVLCGGGTLVLMLVEEFLHLLAVGGPQLLQRSSFICFKLGLSLAERPQLLFKISTHLLHLVKTMKHVLFPRKRLCGPASPLNPIKRASAERDFLRSRKNALRRPRCSFPLCSVSTAQHVVVASKDLTDMRLKKHTKMLHGNVMLCDANTHVWT